MMVKDRIKLHNLPVVAAGIGFWGFLALIPFSTAMIGMYSIISDPEEIVEQVEDLDLPESISGIILDPVEQGGDEVDAASESDSDVGKIIGVALGIVLALWAASGGIKHLMNSLNQSFDEVESRKFVPLRGTALGLTIGTILFIGLSVFTLAGLPALLDSIGLGRAASLAINIIRFPLLLALAVGAFAILYKFGPDHKTYRTGWAKGAIVALCVLIPAVILIGIFSVPITTGSFAALGGIALSMVTLLAMAAAILIGGEWIRSEEILSGRGPLPTGPEALAGTPRFGATDAGPRAEVPRTLPPDEEVISPTQAKALTGAAILAAAFQTFRGSNETAAAPKPKKAKKTKVKKAKVVKTVNKKDFESRRIS